MKETSPSIIFVAGMHRSGTSVISSQLALLGNLIPDDALPAAEDNQAGFFESDTVTRINEKTLENFGSNWRDPSALPANWLDTAKSSPLYDEACEFLGRYSACDGTLIVKDPRISKLLPFWLSASSDKSLAAAVLVVYRDPVSVARSLWARNNIPSGHSMQLWCRYYIDLWESIRSVPHAVVEFERYVANPEEVRHKSESLGIIQAAHQNAVDPLQLELVHHNGSAPECRNERALQEDYNRKPPGGLMAESLLRFHYSVLGGDNVAVERRHYGTIAMILDKVVDENKT